MNGERITEVQLICYTAHNPLGIFPFFFLSLILENMLKVVQEFRSLNNCKIIMKVKSSLTILFNLKK